MTQRVLALPFLTGRPVTSEGPSPLLSGGESLRTLRACCPSGTLREVTIRLAVVTSMALVSSCGSNPVATHGSSNGSPATTASTRASASTTAGASPLFAVLETRRAAAEGYPSHDTVAIANSQGYAVAKTSFTPRSVPQQFDAATVMQPEAYIAARAVYYSDGSGVVRRLDATGTVATVATFPLTSAEQELSFAVSPDGSQLMAARLTFPMLRGTPPPTPTGDWSLDVMRATAGAATKQVQHWQAGPTNYPGGPGGFTTIFLVGWDSTGPIGLVGANIGTQQAQFDGQRFFGGRLAYLDANGQVGTTIGGSDCSPFAPPQAGRVICATNSGQSITVSVRAVDGHEIWRGQAPNPPSNFGGGFVLSADGQRLAMDGSIVTLATAATSSLPSSFTPAAWLDTTDLIGTIQNSQAVVIVHLSQGPSLENWGFAGQIVGDVLP